MTSRLLSWLIWLPMLAACGGGTVTLSDFEFAGSYDPGMVQYAARDGALPVELNGAPFAVPLDAAALAAALPTPAWLGAVHFVPAPPGAGGYRVVLSFAPGGAAGSIRVAATFRSATQAVSMVSAQGPVGTGPTDPAFRELLSEVILALLPATSSGRPGGSGGSGGGAGM